MDLFIYSSIDKAEALADWRFLERGTGVGVRVGDVGVGARRGRVTKTPFRDTD